MTTHDTRITPARAGNSGTVIMEGEIVTDHPRACGEQWMGCFRRLKHWGSPPRVRGTAGWGWKTGPPAGDHPRACGEQLVMRTRKEDT